MLRSGNIRPEEEILIGRSFRNQEILSASIIPLKESGAAVLPPLRRANEGRLWGAGANQRQPDLRAYDRRVCAEWPISKRDPVPVSLRRACGHRRRDRLLCRPSPRDRGRNRSELS